MAPGKDGRCRCVGYEQLINAMLAGKFGKHGLDMGACDRVFWSVWVDVQRQGVGDSGSALVHLRMKRLFFNVDGDDDGQRRRENADDKQR